MNGMNGARASSLACKIHKLTLLMALVTAVGVLILIAVIAVVVLLLTRKKDQRSEDRNE
jgi:hypothetical protein